MSSTSGFYFFQPPAGVPSDWESPDDYFNGQFYTRYEIISIASDEPIGIQFGIWQNQPGETYDSETMENLRKIYTGAGTVITNHSSPSTWWHNHDGVDFGRVYDFDRLGIVLWCLSPQIYIAPASWGGNAEVWDTRDRWFPCSIKVTVVAVSAGSTFSGWDNYVTPTPSFTINYSTEKTNQAVPSTVEYSYSSSMSPAYPGTGVALNLLPGQDVYFRYIGQTGVRHLDVPSRPAAPAITINYPDEVTSSVSSTMEYSVSSSMSPATTGANSAVDLTPGTDLYIRYKATTSQFSSNIQHLDVPSRSAAPAITINYPDEVTSSVSSTMEYSVSSSISPATTGANSAVDLTPGTDLYIRYKATVSHFSSTIHHLDVPSRPAAPAITINYPDEVTSSVSSTMEYSVSSSMSSATAGANSAVDLTPGTDLYIRYKATASQFSSAIQHLDVPSRPATSSFSFDYLTEKTTEDVSPDTEYDISDDFSSPQGGTGNQVTVTPGEDLYFRKKATSSSFASPAFHLVVPSRPGPPSVSVDYRNEKTTLIDTTMEWSYDSLWLSVTQGDGDAIDVTPGTDLYFRFKATVDFFASQPQHLEIPGRPAVPVYTIDFFGETTNEAVAEGDDYSTNGDLNPSTPGTNAKLTVTPGITLYFRTRFTDSSFQSAMQALDVPERPVKPSFSIDYVNETTAEPVAENIEYSTLPDFSEAMTGPGETITIEAGQIVFFRHIADTSSFRSDVFELHVPERSYLNYSGADTIFDDHFVISAVLSDTTEEFDLNCLLVWNGTARNLCDGNIFDVYPSSEGQVIVMIPANTFTNGNFASNKIIVFYKAPSSVSFDHIKEHFRVYPNPSNGDVFIISESDIPYTVDVISTEGKILKNCHMCVGNHWLDLSDLKKGIYFLKILSGHSTGNHKLILE
ncbi:MAG: T9SS type A sorting domain-containing protein [Bacteroidales bacterium]|nr:T9SS type A sorting domain-containing protein [Bacteroidales bacterium]